MIHTRALTRHFKVPRKKEVVDAVRGLDLHVEAGELVAFLGPNGAGKSTSLRMLTTLLEPTSGTAEVAGWDVRTHPAEVRRRIGYVGQGNGAGHYQRVRDELRSQGRAYGLDRREASARADELIEELDLGSLAKRAVMTLSGGQRRRVDVALGLVHRPKLLFLDEPTTGLDPQSRANLWDHILRLRAEHDMTIFLTTHYLDEADTMADRVMIVDHGRLIADGTAARLKADLAGERITATFDDELAAKQAAEIAERTANPAEVVVDTATLRLRVADGTSTLPALLRALDAAGVNARTADLHRPTLDDVFLLLTGRSLRESAA